MALTSGTRLGPYEIAAQIGVGGMGEMYRATDTNLGRDVAIKVLPESVAQDTISIAGERGSQSFSPNPASAGGRMVMWRNDDGVTHHIVANDGSFDTRDITPGAISTMVQMPQGGLNYHCSIHPTTMFGAIGGGGGEAPPACEDYCED